MFPYTTRLLAILLFFGAVFFTACDDDDPMIENEEEVITSVVLSLTPTSGGSPVLFSFTDLDGDGAMAPITTATGQLAANSEYTGSITFSNESNPLDPEDITSEVREEDDEHQVFYVTEGGVNLDLVYADQDGDGNPLGLVTTASTGDASTGQLRVVLRHEPTKGTTTTIDNLAAAGGSTDVEVVFDVTVE